MRPQAYGVPLDGATWQTDWFFNFGLWPNATLYAFPYADMVGTFIMNPTGPETSILRFGYYGVEGRETSGGDQGLHSLDESRSSVRRTSASTTRTRRA